MKPYNVVMRMTRSQHMALMSVLLEAARDESKTQIFVDCSTPETVQTSLGDLLVVATEALREIEVLGEAA